MGVVTAARLGERSRIKILATVDATHRRLLGDAYAVVTRPLLHPVELVAAASATVLILGLIMSGAGTRRRRSRG